VDGEVESKVVQSTDVESSTREMETLKPTTEKDLATTTHSADSKSARRTRFQSVLQNPTLH
jgi:hypothetical protein